MPGVVARIHWRCKQCNKHRWLKPHEARSRVYCSRACLHAGLKVPEPVRVKQSAKRTYGERLCGWCGNPFTARTQIQKYCSQACSVKQFGRRRVSGELVARPCEVCGKEFRPKSSKAAGRFCSRACYHVGTRGENAFHWRGGRHVDGNGYVKVQAPDHPAAHGHGGYVLEHRLVMERQLGRHLESHETVHHINGDKTDNRPENLQLRSGKHGKGVVRVCLDCGSHNVSEVAIAG